MLTKAVAIDKSGRITLPDDILNALGIYPETEAIIELTETGVLIKSRHTLTPITDQIAAMNLPVDDWEQMEQEIKADRDFDHLDFVTRIDPLAYTPSRSSRV